MYICPICNRTFATEEQVTKHSLPCWREQNPNHQSKQAPCSGNIHKRQMNDDVAKFFASFERK